MERPDEDLIALNVRLPRALVESIVMRATTPRDDPASRRLAFAKWILAIRRRRVKWFRGIRLGEPTWDMILDLYVADREDRRVDISGICIASGIAPSTALRYLRCLTADGLVARVEDKTDGRRIFIEMSTRLRIAIDDWLDQAGAGLNFAVSPERAIPMSDQLKDANRVRSR